MSLFGECSVSLARAVSDAGMGELRQMITYQAGWYGLAVVEADRWFPRSKTCSGCDNVKADLTLSDRSYRCDPWAGHRPRRQRSRQPGPLARMRRGRADRHPAPWGRGSEPAQDQPPGGTAAGRQPHTLPLTGLGQGKPMRPE